MVTLGIVALLAIRNPPLSQTAGFPAPAATLDSRAIVIAPFEPTTQDEATQMLAPIVTDLLRTRLAALQNLVVDRERLDRERHADRTGSRRRCP